MKPVFPKFESVTMYVHRVDEGSKTLFASFSSEKSKVPAGSKPPIPIPMAHIPKNREDAKDWLLHFGVGVLMIEQGNDAIVEDDIAYFNDMVGKSFIGTKTPLQLLEQFYNARSV